MIQISHNTTMRLALLAFWCLSAPAACSLGGTSGSDSSESASTDANLALSGYQEVFREEFDNLWSSEFSSRWTVCEGTECYAARHGQLYSDGCSDGDIVRCGSSNFDGLADVNRNGQNDDKVWFHRDNVSTEWHGGVSVLRLGVRRNNRNPLELTASQLSSENKFTFKYGYLEARMWMPARTQNTTTRGQWYAFWTRTQKPSPFGCEWPFEMDVMESLGIDEFANVQASGTYHYHVGDCQPKRSPSYGADNAIWTANDGRLHGEWHRFGLLWEPGKLSWYVDGVFKRAIYDHVTDLPQYILLSHVYGGWDPSSVPDESTAERSDMYVDWVRVLQKNGPADDRSSAGGQGDQFDGDFSRISSKSALLVKDSGNSELFGGDTVRLMRQGNGQERVSWYTNGAQYFSAIAYFAPNTPWGHFNFESIDDTGYRNVHSANIIDRGSDVPGGWRKIEYRIALPPKQQTVTIVYPIGHGIGADMGWAQQLSEVLWR